MLGFIELWVTRGAAARWALRRSRLLARTRCAAGPWGLNDHRFGLWPNCPAVLAIAGRRRTRLKPRTAAADPFGATCNPCVPRRHRCAPNALPHTARYLVQHPGFDASDSCGGPLRGNLQSLRSSAASMRTQCPATHRALLGAAPRVRRPRVERSSRVGGPLTEVEEEPSSMAVGHRTWRGTRSQRAARLAVALWGRASTQSPRSLKPKRL